MSLEPFDYFNGIIGLLAIIISFYVSIRILLRGYEVREKNLILVGITGIFTSEPWWASIINFVLIAFTGIELPDPVGHFIGIVFQPIGIFTWLFAVTNLLNVDKQKLVLALFGIYSIIFEMTFLIIFAHDPPLSGTFFGIHSALIPTGFMFTFLIIIVTTGMLFARESLKAEDKEIITKGKLIAFAFVTYAIAATIDGFMLMFDLFSLLAPINRIILISSAFGFYGGFLLPDWMKKLLNKKKVP